jgi:hypothetical protein
MDDQEESEPPRDPCPLRSAIAVVRRPAGQRARMSSGASVSWGLAETSGSADEQKRVVLGGRRSTFTIT